MVLKNVLRNDHKTFMHFVHNNMRISVMRIMEELTQFWNNAKVTELSVKIERKDDEGNARTYIIKKSYNHCPNQPKQIEADWFTGVYENYSHEEQEAIFEHRD